MSIHIGGSTPVQLTVGQLFATVVALLAAGIGAFWAIADFSNASLREDVSAIRATLGTLQGSDKDNALNVKQSEVDFTRQLGALNVSLVQFGGKVDLLSAKFDAVDKSMQLLSGQIDTVRRQLAAPRGTPFDPEALAAALKKAGYEGKVVVLVPYGPSPQAEPK